MRTTRTLAAVSVPVLLTMAGCANPLWPASDDYGASPRFDRLRNIEPLDLQSAAKPAPPPEEAERIEPPADIWGEGEEAEISIEQARAEALRNNLDIRVALVDPAIAAEAVSVEEAAFESAFTLRANYADADTPTSSTLSSARSESMFIEPGVRIPLLSGGTANVSFPVTRSETNNAFATLNPAWDADLSFSVSQPLLRGAGRRSTTHALRVAALNRSVSEATTRVRIIGELRNVEAAYWQLYRAREELRIRLSQFDVAKALLERAERLFDAGTVAEIEVIRARSGAAQRLDAIIRAGQDVRARERELKRVLNMEGLDVNSGARVVPASLPDPVEYEFDAETLAASAVETRAEMLELELRLAIDASQIEFARNQKLPLLNLQLDYDINGLDGDFEGAASGVTERPYQDDWSIGLNAEVPFGNQLAESRLQQAILTRLQRINTREAREKTIRQGVYDAVDAIEAGWQRILAARQSVLASSRALEAEQRQFDLGTSTSTDVLDAASRLADERSSEIRAIVDYQIAQVDLAVATGTLLGASKVGWEPERFGE